MDVARLTDRARNDLKCVEGRKTEIKPKKKKTKRKKSTKKKKKKKKEKRKTIIKVP